MVAPGDFSVGPTGPPEVYPRLGPDSERRLFFDRAWIPVFRSIADPVGEVAGAADRPESGQDEMKAR